MHTKIFLFFIATCALFLHADEQGKDAWETSKFIWNLGIASQCDAGMEKSPFHYFSKEPHFHKKNYQNIKSGDVVWIRCKSISKFSKDVLPKVKHPFVLVICDGDESFPSDCGKEFLVEDFLCNKKIIHVFAQNCDYKGSSKKISHLPIGIDLHTIAYKGSNGAWGESGTPGQQEECLEKILQGLQPTKLRKVRAYVNFQLADTMRSGFQRYLQFGEDRTTIFNRLLPTGLIDYSGTMKRSDLWKTKGEYAFSISPHGNGLDCHRTWEDLILGCIVIVKTSPLDPLYEGLPVVIVRDWSEITKEHMDLWLEQYGDAFTNPTYREKLLSVYWMDKILERARPYRK